MRRIRGIVRIRRTVLVYSPFLPPGGDKPPPLRRYLRSRRRGGYQPPAKAFPAHGEGGAKRRMRSSVFPRVGSDRQIAPLALLSWLRAAKDLAPVEELFIRVIRHILPHAVGILRRFHLLRMTCRRRLVFPIHQNTPRAFALGVSHSGSCCAVSGETGNRPCPGQAQSINNSSIETPSTLARPYSSMSVTVRCLSSIREMEPRQI